MDDLLLFTPSKHSHIAKLDDLLNALLKYGLKISPKKCQLFRTNLQYMGNEIFIKDKRVCVKPLRNRLEAIQKLQPPTTVKVYRSHAGMVNFLSMFCSELQKILKPIYDLRRKDRQFLWGKEQQDAFEVIKCRLINLQFYICPTQLVDFIYIQIQAHFNRECTISNTKWEAQINSLCEQMATRSSKELFHYRIRTMWISYKHSTFFSFVKKIGL